LKLSTCVAFVICTGASLCGCQGDSRNPSSDIAVIKIDGSSTVFPIAEAAAEDYQLQSRARVRVTVGISGTGGGFKKLCRGDVDISNASRPILTQEMQACRAAGISYIEIPIAFDAVTVVVNPANTWVKELRIEDLKKMWEPAAQANVTRWNQIRPEWPDAKLMLFGPGADSGTFDYFTEAVVGKAKASRGDYTASEDDNVLVQGVAHNRDALGYFGFAYYANHKEQMRAVPIIADDKAGAANGKATLPSIEAVRDGSYQPLSRPLFVYVNAAAAKRPEIQQFVEYYLIHGAPLASEAGFVPLPDGAAQLALQHFHEQRLGTVFGGIPEIGVTIDALLAREAKQ
jgi:phosphate transport system substrate-binding protein